VAANFRIFRISLSFGIQSESARFDCRATRRMGIAVSADLLAGADNKPLTAPTTCDDMLPDEAVARVSSRRCVRNAGVKAGFDWRDANE
jgi:hypothetical protein